MHVFRRLFDSEPAIPQPLEHLVNRFGRNAGCTPVAIGNVEFLQVLNACKILGQRIGVFDLNPAVFANRIEHDDSRLFP